MMSTIAIKPLILLLFLVLGCRCCPFHSGSTTPATTVKVAPTNDSARASPTQFTMTTAHEDTETTIKSTSTRTILPTNLPVPPTMEQVTTIPPTPKLPTTSMIDDTEGPRTTDAMGTVTTDSYTSTETPTNATEEPCFCKGEMKNLRKRLIGEEGIRLTAYDAKPNNPDKIDLTICVGFNLKRADAEAIFKKLFPEVNFKEVKAMKKALTLEQCLKLFYRDLDKKFIPDSKKIVGKKLCDLPTNVKIAIVSAVYRTDLRANDKTAQLIRDGKWCDVSKEYLDHKGYKTAAARGMSGIPRRMEWNAKQFDSMCVKKGAE